MLEFYPTFSLKQINICVMKLVRRKKRGYNTPMLTWEDSFAIARELRSQHPEIELEQISLEMIYRWVVDLDEFFDDRELVNDEILAAIYQEWLEEAYS